MTLTIPPAGTALSITPLDNCFKDMKVILSLCRVISSHPSNMVNFANQHYALGIRLIVNVYFYGKEEYLNSELSPFVND